MCQVFGVSRSGYYNWVQHEPSDRKQSDERLKLEIKVAHIRTRETYGTRWLQTELAENGIIVGRDRLARLRKELRLICKQTIVSVVTLVWGISPRQPSGKNIIRWLLKKEQMVVSAIASTPQRSGQERKPVTSASNEGLTSGAAG